ncbi:hypothetical protein ACWGI9_28510 [Streptomyces sp. NPDC054833]
MRTGATETRPGPPGPSLPDFSALADGRLRFRAAGDPAERASGKLTLVSYAVSVSASPGSPSLPTGPSRSAAGPTATRDRPGDTVRLRKA